MSLPHSCSTKRPKYTDTGGGQLPLSSWSFKFCYHQPDLDLRAIDCSNNDLQLYLRAFDLTQWELAASFEKSRMRLLNSHSKTFQSHFHWRGSGLTANGDRWPWCLSLGWGVIVATQDISFTTSSGRSLAEAERGAIHRLGGRGHKNLSNNPEWLGTPEVFAQSTGGHRLICLSISEYCLCFLFSPSSAPSTWRLLSYFLKWETSLCSISTLKKSGSAQFAAFLNLPQIHLLCWDPQQFLQANCWVDTKGANNHFLKASEAGKTLSQLHF